MILTIVGANFAGANIGQNKSVTITLNKTGANGSKSSVTLEKDKSVSSVTVIATGLSLKTGYENLVVTVTMAGTGDVSSWYSNGTVTIPSGTTITGNITITATATKTTTGGGEVVDPEEPGTGGGDATSTIIPDASALRHNLAYSLCATDGELLQTNASFTFKVVSDYIEIPSGYVISEFGAVADLSLSNVGGIQKPNCYCAFYDSNKTFISSVSPQESDPKVDPSNSWRYTTTPPSIPNNAKYIRVGYNDKLGVEKNESYIFYGKTSPTLVFTKE